MADEKIQRLEKLNEERRELIAKTEAKLNDRKESLAKSEAELEKVKARRDDRHAGSPRRLRKPQGPFRREGRAGKASRPAGGKGCDRGRAAGQAVTKSPFARKAVKPPVPEFRGRRGFFYEQRGLL